MLFQAWQVGLDIQTNSIQAIAIQRRRYGWQLRQWWQIPLSQPVLHDGLLIKESSLINALREWRKLLPHRISLRVALPAQRVLQAQIPIPDTRLQEPARREYILAQGQKRFPLDGHTLVIDYRLQDVQAQQLLLTAARHQELQCWVSCLQQANLTPQIIDIAPCALRIMANTAGINPSAGLLHRLDNEWLWVSPLNAPFRYGLLASQDYRHALQAVVAVRESCSLPDQAVVFCSGFLTETLPNGCVPWSPFKIFAQLHPPLPPLPMIFVLAAGLAVREEDSCDVLC